MSEPKRRIVGKVLLEGDKYFIDVAGRREELPPGVIGDEAELKELVGEQVEVFYSEPTRFIVGLKHPRRPPWMCYLPRPPWLCYLPPPWVFKGFEKEIRLNLARQFLEEGLISKEVYDRLL
jgi:hypothetical protein